MATDPVRVQTIFDVVVKDSVEETADFAGSALSFCTQTSNVQMAEQLYVYMKPQQLPILSAFISFYAEAEQHEKACDVYEHDLLRLLGTGEDASDAQGQCSLHLDARMERSLMNTALK